MCSHMITAKIQHADYYIVDTCVATCSMSPCVLLSVADLLLQTSSLKAGSKKTRGEKTQLEQVLMEAMALHYSEPSLWPSGMLSMFY